MRTWLTGATKDVIMNRMTTTTRHRGQPIRLRRQPADIKTKPATAVVCPNGDDFGMDLTKFRTVHPNLGRVTCPFCGTPTPIPGS